jgi:hypothetical protein
VRSDARPDGVSDSRGVATDESDAGAECAEDVADADSGAIVGAGYADDSAIACIAEARYEGDGGHQPDAGAKTTKAGQYTRAYANAWRYAGTVC